MKPFTEFLKRHSLITGIALMFLFTWPLDLANAGIVPFKVPFVIYIMLGWGLIFASLIMTGLTVGREGVTTLIKRFLIWRVGWMWYLVAFLLYPVIFASAVLVNAGWTHAPVDFSEVFAHKIFGASANLPAFILPFFIFDFLSNGEEMGWRGYVLPRLQAKQTALVSSLILGVIWAFWHFPRYLAPDNNGSFMWMLIKVLADSVIYTWVYNNTKGSLLLTTILHAASNTAGVFLPIANTQSGEHMDVYITAIIFLIIMAAAVTINTSSETLLLLKSKQVQN